MEDIEQCPVCEDLTMDDSHSRHLGMCETCFEQDSVFTWRAIEETHELI